MSYIMSYIISYIKALILTACWLVSFPIMSVTSYTVPLLSIIVLPPFTISFTLLYSSSSETRAYTPNCLL